MILKVGEYGIEEIRRYDGTCLKIISINKYNIGLISIDDMVTKRISLQDNKIYIYCKTEELAMKLLEMIDIMFLPNELRLLKLSTLDK
ncbi:hypothetical protein M0Q50_05350 [bacterium]|jgi:hypothetical protein|nr:hypothetical protein [bacterium]